MCFNEEGTCVSKQDVFFTEGYSVLKMMSAFSGWFFSKPHLVVVSPSGPSETVKTLLKAFIISLPVKKIRIAAVKCVSIYIK